eukprot:2191175-Amphidinium_carterae.1
MGASLTYECRNPQVGTEIELDLGITDAENLAADVLRATEVDVLSTAGHAAFDAACTNLPVVRDIYSVLCRIAQATRHQTDLRRELQFLTNVSAHICRRYHQLAHTHDRALVESVMQRIAEKLRSGNIMRHLQSSPGQ